MEHQVEIPTLGKGHVLLALLKRRLPQLNDSAFTFGEPRIEDGNVIVEFDLDEAALLAWALRSLFEKYHVDLVGMGLVSAISRVPKRARTRRGKFVEDNPETEANEAWEGGKTPAKKKKAPAKKKAAPRKRAAKKTKG